MAKLQRIRTSAVSAIIQKLGFKSAIRMPLRRRRSGFSTSQFKPFVVAVEWKDWGKENNDYFGQSEKLVKPLEDRGFKVQRPWPDKAILAITHLKTESLMGPFEAMVNDRSI